MIAPPLVLVAVAVVVAIWCALRAIARTGTAALLLIGAMASVAVAALLVLR